MLPPYRFFNSAEFADRPSEFERIETLLKDKNRGVIILEGDRGSGKTTFLFELYRRLEERGELRPFLISLFPYSAPEFERHKNIWFSSERTFQKEDIPETLIRLARYLEIDAIESGDRNFQKDYFARGLAYRASKTIPVLLVDSIYECTDDIRIELEKYILAPILASERIFIILSGRGKHPIWSSPELINAEIFEFHPLQDEFIIEQLEKLKKLGKLKRDPSEYKAIVDLSGGYPLLVRVMAESNKQLPSALNDAINIIILETLPESEWKNLEKIRPVIEKLSLIDIPFRVPDIDEYLYGNDPERRVKTNNLIKLLLESCLLRYKGKGYQLNHSVIYPIRKWLALNGQGLEYMGQLQIISAKLQENYPSAKAWYQQMLPTDIALPKNIFSPAETNRTDLT